MGASWKLGGAMVENSRCHRVGGGSQVFGGDCSSLGQFDRW